MSLNKYCKFKIKEIEIQSLKHKRNEKNTRALRRQQKECWNGSLHSGSIYYALQSSVKKPDKALQEAIQKRLKR